MYNNIYQIEPFFPAYNRSELEDKAYRLVALSGSLGSTFNETTAKQVAELVKKMNSYYSNLIEGNPTTPLEIEKALQKLSTDPAKLAKELEHIAHIDVQNKIDEKLKKNEILNICTPEFILWIHKEFYEHLPEKFRIITRPDKTSTILKPGELREEDVQIGEHIPPEYKKLGEFLERFCEVYDTTKLRPIDKIIAAAASHHRLAWIHPFLDGNGRVVRLFTHAYLIKAEVNTRGLWSVSRGFARNVNAYYGKLQEGDMQRRDDYDGRGNLSDRGLYEFCDYFLNTAIDQVQYMTSLYELNNITSRIKKFVELKSDLKDESYNILKEAFLTGEVRRGDALNLTGLPERTARRVLKSLLDKNLLVSDTPKSPVKINFPVEALEYYFPKLYPAI